MYRNTNAIHRDSSREAPSLPTGTPDGVAGRLPVPDDKYRPSTDPDTDSADRRTSRRTIDGHHALAGRPRHQVVDAGALVSPGRGTHTAGREAQLGGEERLQRLAAPGRRGHP